MEGGIEKKYILDYKEIAIKKQNQICQSKKLNQDEIKTKSNSINYLKTKL